MKARFFFDIISPFAYLMVEQLHRLPDSVDLEYRPVLFAALLDHWSHKGPAEIPSKRRFTYRRVQWTARHLDVPLKFPPAHPFNPLPLLRLAVLLGNDGDRIRTLFRSVWREGQLPGSVEDLDALGRKCGVESASQAVARSDVKQALRANYEEAIAAEVFGVPTITINGELFWGVDSLDMLLEFVSDPQLFKRGELMRVSELPIGVMRKIN